MSAWTELQEYLHEGETVQSLVFGAWGWGDIGQGGEPEPGYGEPDTPPVPMVLRGQLLTPLLAEPYMQSWSFYGGFGAPRCYAVRVWTDKRVIWVNEYDGSTSLASCERHPTACWPGMSGG